MTNVITNTLGRTSYPAAPANWVEGQVLRGDGHPYAIPRRRQVTRVAFGGTASDGNYVTTITRSDGTSITVTTTRATTPSTNANLATQHALDVMAATGALGVIKSATVVSSTNVDIVFRVRGYAYTVETSAPGSGTLTATLRTAAAGETIKSGRFVAVDTLDSISSVRNLASTDAASAIAGFVGRDMTGARPFNPAVDDEPSHGPGSAATCYSRGVEAVVVNVGGSTATVGAGVFVVVNAAGGDEVGQVRATDDGSNAVELSSTQARWLDPVPVGGLGRILINI